MWGKDGRGDRGVEKTPDEKLYLFFFLNIIGTIKSNSVRWAGHVARMGVTEKNIFLLQRNVTERDHLEDKEGEGRIFIWA
jgi:hypothetical protein